MSRAEYLASRGMDRPRPGGRWHRILRALTAGPVAFGDLFRATDPGKYEPRHERVKMRRALKDLAALELVDRAPPWGWVLTPAGLETLAELDRRSPGQEAPPCAA